MDPCLVPLIMENKVDLAPPHLTHAYWFSYTAIRVLTTIAGIFLSMSFVKRMLNLQVSKALLQSRRVIMGLDPLCRKCCTTSVTNQLLWVVLVPTL